MAITKIGTPELFDFSATNTALQLPTGDTASRPTSPSTGEWRYNTTFNYVEYYDGAAWFRIDTEAIPAPTPVGSEHFNVNTYFGNGATQTIDAKFNEAAAFNGSSSGINIGAVIPNTDTDYSISTWINIDSGFTSGNRTILGAATSSGGTEGSFRFQLTYVSANTYQITIARTVATSGTNFYYSSSWTSSSINTGQWYNIVATYNSTGRVAKTYLNGAAVDSVALTTSASVTSVTNNLIGGQRTSTAKWLGKIDQVRIFNTAITAAEAEDLYTDETTTTAATLNFPAGAGCIAAYQLDGNGDDISGNYSATSTTNIGYTGLKFQPDFVWTKQRNGTAFNILIDSVRGNTKELYSNDTSSQGTSSNTITSFLSNGYSIGSNGGLNGVNNTYVSWNWRAAGFANDFNVLEGGTVTTSSSAATAGITAGSITTGWNVSANRDAEFSIVKYTGTGGTGTVGTGLSSPAELIIRKNLDASSTGADWYVYAPASPYFGYLQTPDTFASDNNAAYSYNQTVPTGSIFNVGNTYSGNINNDDYIAYCFRSVVGYQKIGSYVGGGSSSNPTVNCGFAPSFLMVKKATGSSSGSSGWTIVDNKRHPGTPTYANGNVLYANEIFAEQDDDDIRGFVITSTGFTPNGNYFPTNNAGDTYIFLAIA